MHCYLIVTSRRKHLYLITDNDAGSESSANFICARRIKVTKSEGVDKFI